MDPRLKGPEKAGPLLAMRNLCKHFTIHGGRILKAVDSVSLAVSRGRTMGLVGESGCGKSTLGRTIVHVYESDGGTIALNGEDVTHLKTAREKRLFTEKVQMIFQDPYASLNPRMTVGDSIAEGWDIQGRYGKTERRSRIGELLAMVGLNEEHAGRYPHEFSGGQRQRIGIARALSMSPCLIICDEPISALDVSIQAQIMNMLVELQEKMGITYLFIAHDISMVRYVSDDIAVMYLGSIVEQGPAGEISRQPLHPYTQALFSAAPVPNPRLEKNRRQILLEGDIPSPVNAPRGCKFSSRCFMAKSFCGETAPPMRELAPDHWAACHIL